MDLEYIKKLYKSSEIEYIDEEASVISDYIEKTLENTENINLLKSENLSFNTIEYNKLRDDIPKESLSVDDALKNTSKRKFSYFEVKEFVE